MDCHNFSEVYPCSPCSGSAFQGVCSNNGCGAAGATDVRSMCSLASLLYITRTATRLSSNWCFVQTVCCCWGSDAKCVRRHPPEIYCQGACTSLTCNTSKPILAVTSQRALIRCAAHILCATGNIVKLSCLKLESYASTTVLHVAMQCFAVFHISVQSDGVRHQSVACSCRVYCSSVVCHSVRGLAITLHSSCMQKYDVHKQLSCCRGYSPLKTG